MKESMDTVSLGYIAGLFDGEGHTRIVSRKSSKNGVKYLTAFVIISNTDRRCLDYVRGALGYGWVGSNGKAKTHRSNRSLKEGMKFQVTNAKAIHFLRLIRPHVKIKGEQIDAVLLNRHNGIA